MTAPQRLVFIAAMALVAGLALAGLTIFLLPRPTPSPPLPPLPSLPEVSGPEGAMLTPAPRARPPLIDEGERASLIQVVERHRRWLAGRPDEREYTYGSRKVTIGELERAFERLAAWLEAGLSAAELGRRLEENFDVMVSVGQRTDAGRYGGEMLVTGYYEPLIEGRLRKSAECDVPIYGHPRDVFTIDLSDFAERFDGVRVSGRRHGNKLLPYPSRRELRHSGELAGRELAWACDKVDLFFVEVQGSGSLLLPGGRTRRFGYAGATGREYRSIGRLLIDQGKLEREKVSMQSIRQHLADHPEEIDAVLDHNESVVFFRWLDGPPVGNLGIPVTAERSIAVDQRLFPPGALAFLDSEIPAPATDGTTVNAGPLRRLVVVQDTGGAIRGTHRVDFFWGRGEAAALRAGLMKQPGRLYFLLPKATPGSSPP